VSTRGRIARVLAVIIGAVCLPMGVYVLWAQHSGVSASVSVVECHRVGRGDECTGQWRDGDEIRSVHIVSATNPDVGDLIRMRIHGGKAYSTSPALPLVFFGFGAALLGAAGYTVLAARRLSPTVAEQSPRQVI
jgi:hypothetical protein